MFNSLIRTFYALTDVELNLGSGGSKILVDSVGGGDVAEVIKSAFGVAGSVTLVSTTDPFPVTDNAAEVSLASIDLKTISGKSSTSAVTSVNDAATNQTLLAANSGRLGASVVNDSTEILYLKLGATASTTSFTVRILPNGYYEAPQPIYTGIIDGIWANNASGSARITELTT